MNPILMIIYWTQHTWYDVFERAEYMTLIHTSKKSTLEYKLDYDENLTRASCSNTGTTNDAGDNITAGSNTTCDQSSDDSSSSSSSDGSGFIVVFVVVGVVALMGIGAAVFWSMQDTSSPSPAGQRGVEVTPTTA